MLTEARNSQLREVGPGTSMGNLMRRYWQPIGAASEFDEKATKPVRLMGEDLVLYKDLSGTFGLLDRHCPHRRADLSYGYVEECGLRCNYHGWLYDESGQCIAQPYEDMAHAEDNLKAKIKANAYPVKEMRGLLWAYMGPQPVPELPMWEPFTWQDGFVQVVLTEIPCNWFQCQENSIDPVHFEWMHSNWSARLDGGDSSNYVAKHKQVDFKEIDWGFTYHRQTEEADENNPLWTVGRVCLWPNALFTGGHFEWRVPIDDDTTLSVGWFFNHVPQERMPYVQNRIPCWESPIKDAETGRWVTSHVMNQDFVAWVGQGINADRSKENLGMSDKGVAMIRKQFFEDMELLENDPSADPKGIVRDPAINDCIDLPIVGKDVLANGVSISQIEDPSIARRVASKRFVFLAGQPEEVRLAYEDAMGFKMDDWQGSGVAGVDSSSAHEAGKGAA